MKISEVLKSLNPRDQEELSVFQFILHCAQSLRVSTQMDLGLGNPRVAFAAETEPNVAMDPMRLLSTLSEESRRYLNGLVEALDIYQNIHGEGFSLQSVTDQTVHELKQIRDMCIEEGLRSIY